MGQNEEIDERVQMDARERGRRDVGRGEKDRRDGERD